VEIMHQNPEYDMPAAYCGCSIIPCIVCVDESERGIIQNCGRFTKLAEPGIQCIAFPFQTLINVSTLTHQLDVHTMTKSKDNVIINAVVAVQFSVEPAGVPDYYFKLAQPGAMIEAFVDDTVRSTLPHLTMDQCFAAQDSLSQRVLLRLTNVLKPFGMEVLDVLVTQLNIHSSVERAMNDIEASKRRRIAAMDKALTQKIFMVTAAEAEAQANELTGKGLAKMRHAIVAGYETAALDLYETTGLHPSEVIDMMLATQYIDVMKDYAEHGVDHLVFLELLIPSAVGRLSTWLLNLVDPEPSNSAVTTSACRDTIPSAAQPMTSCAPQLLGSFHLLCLQACPTSKRSSLLIALAEPLGRILGEVNRYVGQVVPSGSVQAGPCLPPGNPSAVPTGGKRRPVLTAPSTAHSSSMSGPKPSNRIVELPEETSTHQVDSHSH